MATQRYSLDIREAGRNWVPRPTLSSADYASPEVWDAEATGASADSAGA